MSKIYQTTDYDKFKILPRNRDVCSNNITESVKKKNMLSSHPILVNENMEVLDGQHRLEAAKKLNVPIYYLIDSSISEEDIPTCQVQRSWDLCDYLKFYKDRNEDYKYTEYCHKYFKIRLPSLIRFLSSDNNRAFPKFRDGSFKIKKDKEILLIKFQLFIDLSKELKNLLEKPYFSKGVEVAIWQLVNTEGYNQEMMLRKIYTYSDQALLAMKFSSTKNVLEHLKEVYNKGAKAQKIS